MGFVVGVIKRLFHPKLALVGGLLWVGWHAYMLFQPEPFPLDEPRQDIAEQACWRAMDQLPSLPLVGEVAVLRVQGDHTGYVTECLRRLIDRTGLYPQVPESAWRKLADKLDVQETAPADAAEAMETGKSLDAPYVLHGRLAQFTSDQRNASIDLRLEMLVVETGEPLAPELTIVLPEDQEASAFSWQRVALWLAATLLLPVLTAPLIRRVLEQESNALTGGLLVAYALTCWLLALGLLGFDMGGWQSALLLGAFVAALGYNYAAFRMVEGRR
jgi:hypothetical protein